MSVYEGRGSKLPLVSIRVNVSVKIWQAGGAKCLSGSDCPVLKSGEKKLR